MFAIVVTEKDGAQRRLEFDKQEVTIGRVRGNDVVLPKGNVSKRHSRIVVKDNRFIVVDLKSTNGTYVNGRKITSPLVVKPGDKIYIGDFVLAIEPMEAVAPAPPPLPSRAPEPSLAAPPAAPVAEPSPAAPPAAPVAEPPRPTDPPPRSRRVTKEPSVARSVGARGAQASVSVSEAPVAGVERDERDRIDPLLADADVREVLVDRFDRVMVDRGHGLRVEEGTRFSSATALRATAEALLARCAVSLDPMAAVGHATLPSGWHLTVLLPPVAEGGPLLHLRRLVMPPTLEQLQQSGWFDAAAVELLRGAVQRRRTVAVLGPGGSGVSTVLGALAMELRGARTALVERSPRFVVPGAVALGGGGSGRGPSLSALLEEAARLGAVRLVVDDVGPFELLDVLAEAASRGGMLMGTHVTEPGDDPVAALRAMALLGHRASADAVEELLARGLGYVVQTGHVEGGCTVLGISEVRRVRQGAASLPQFVREGGRLRPVGG